METWANIIYLHLSNPGATGGEIKGGNWIWIEVKKQQQNKQLLLTE